MKRPSSIHFRSPVVTMSYRPYAAQRSYFPADGAGENNRFVNGDSHVNSIPYHPTYTPPPHHHHPCQQFPQNHQFYPPRQQDHHHPRQQFPQNHQFYPPRQQEQYRPPHQQFYQNHQFSAPRQPLNNFRPPHQYLPRPTKSSDYRKWVYAIPEPAPHCERFTILSYNLLADYLATKGRGQLYGHIPRQFLDWQWRKRSIAFELGLWSADILCFQEVDKFQELEELLKPRGYTGIWKMRTGDPVDGCAIFWHTSRFKLLYEESIEFNKYGLRDNVAQICVMESSGCIGNAYESASTTSPRQCNKIIVCNTHVLFNPKRGDIKLGQVRELFHRADAVAKLWNEAPIILCGDFNSTPKSPLYNFIEEQKLDLSGLPRNRVSGQLSEAPQVPSNNPGVQHIYGLAGDSLATNRKGTVNIGSPKIAENGGQAYSMMKELPEVSFGDRNEDGDQSTECGSEDVVLSSHIADKWQKSSPTDLPQVSSSENIERSSSEILGGRGECKSLDEDIRLQDGSSNAPNFREVDSDKFMYDPYGWTAEEMRTATGNADSKVVKHPIKLKSTYTEVKQDNSGTRDSSGEPLVTAYNQRFQGIVDYIWRSEGLQTVRVLAPLPKSAMAWTQGFPTKKWGSDHIALVSELAFVKDCSTQDMDRMFAYEHQHLDGRSDQSNL